MEDIGQGQKEVTYGDNEIEILEQLRQDRALSQTGQEDTARNAD